MKSNSNLPSLPVAEQINGSRQRNWNLKLPMLKCPTLGGKQYWSDVRHFHGWRIQQHAIRRTFRLLDKRGRRYAAGSLLHCQNALEGIRLQQSLPSVTGKVLIVLHGLIRTRYSMRKLSKFVESNSDWQVLNVSYASTRDSIASHAQALASILHHLPEVDQIGFVGHSLGNIVVRHLLGDLKKQSTFDVEASKFHRMVMLGPPNQGSQFASRFHNWFTFRTIFGTSGQQLARGWNETEKRLAIPEFEFAIIAGGRDEKALVKNPLINGKDDLVVSVDETYLQSAKAIAVRPVTHSFMMDDGWIHQSMLNFLEHGCFAARPESGDQIE